jgi:uncharacterized protein (TIGR02246 family)
MRLRFILFTITSFRLVAADGDVDQAAIRAVHQAYRDAWRANDAAAVKRVFTDDAVLLPHHGDPPVIGIRAIEKFWWPPSSPPATVTKFDTTIDETGGSGTIAFVRGRFTLEYSFDDKGVKRTFTNSGTFIELLRKQPGGSWRISHRMWDDPQPREIR